MTEGGGVEEVEGRTEENQQEEKITLTLQETFFSVKASFSPLLHSFMYLFIFEQNEHCAADGAGL